MMSEREMQDQKGGEMDAHLENILDAYAASEPGPSRATLAEWIREYPQFARELTEFTASWQFLEWTDEAPSLDASAEVVAAGDRLFLRAMSAAQSAFYAARASRKATKAHDEVTAMRTKASAPATLPNGQASRTPAGKDVPIRSLAWTAKEIGLREDDLIDRLRFEKGPETDKKPLNEQDIRSKFILPAILAAGWDIMRQVREEVQLTNGRVLVKGKLTGRAAAKRVDYVLYHRSDLPLAIIEAKDNSHALGAGMQQALGYAELLDAPFVFSSNGDGFLFHDRTGLVTPVETELAIDSFPRPDELWGRYRTWKGLDAERERVITQEYYIDGSGKEPRYYQRVAINRTVEAVARGQNRLLLVMATGTGKTYTAFQIIWRLWKAGIKKRILFLADRNILVDQTKTNDFKPFGSAMTKITNRTIDKSYEIYLSLYQAVTGADEERNIYREFSRDFFDLVVVDECHRGSAAEDSNWREILDYFSSATHLGMTATPKETEDVSNIFYFGEPVYTYSLRQGIEDGFLAPYKVVRVDIDRDLSGWRPEQGQTDKYGELIEDRIYNQRDFDRTLILEERTTLVAGRISEYLKGTDRFAKTIVFCETTDHAERMRQALVNANADLASADRRYVMRITGDDTEGKRHLDDFINPESIYPVIVTTSELMTTGVDAQTCKLIALDQRIQSMTKFKQIIGRGTRINEEFDKLWFSIIDFKKATELFADPAFDGDPVQIYEPNTKDSIVPPVPDEPGAANAISTGFDVTTLGEDTDGRAASLGTGKGKRYVVAGVTVSVVSERVQYYGPDGRLITESLKDYTRRKVSEDFASLDEFLRGWGAAEKKEAIIREMEERGVLFSALADEVGRDFDPFDLVCHVAFGQPALTRRERADRVRKRDYFSRFGAEARAVLDALLAKYADEGVGPLEQLDVLRVQPLAALGTPAEIIGRFGGRSQYLKAVSELESAIYSAA
jgi:type I restriction enzyme R subunit